MDAERPPDLADGRRDDLLDLFRQTPAVCVAQNQPVGPRIQGGVQRAEGVLGVDLVTVEEMLGVEEDGAAGAFQKCDRITDHRQVLVKVGPQDLRHVEVPGLADDGHRLGPGRNQALKRDVVGRFGAHAPRHSEGDRYGMGQGFGPEGVEDGLVFGVRDGVPRFDVVHAEVVEASGDIDLVLEAETDALALGAVAERRVVNGYRFHGLRLVCWVRLWAENATVAWPTRVTPQKNPEPPAPGPSLPGHA